MRQCFTAAGLTFGFALFGRDMQLWSMIGKHTAAGDKEHETGVHSQDTQRYSSQENPRGSPQGRPSYLIDYI